MRGGKKSRIKEKKEKKLEKILLKLFILLGLELIFSLEFWSSFLFEDVWTLFFYTYLRDTYILKCLNFVPAFLLKQIEWIAILLFNFLCRATYRSISRSCSIATQLQEVIGRSFFILSITLHPLLFTRPIHRATKVMRSL